MMRKLKPLASTMGMLAILIFIINKPCLSSNHIEDTTTANIYFEKAKLLEDSAKYDSAIVYFEEASEIYLAKKFWGKHINSLRGIASQYRNKADYKNAQNQLNIAINLAHKKLENTDINLGDCYNLQGSIYLDLSNLDSSLLFFNKALDIRTKKLGLKSMKVAESYQNIGVVLAELAEYEESEKYYTKALSICKELNKINDQLTAGIYNSLAVLAFEKGDYTKSEEYMLKVLQIRQNLLGENHPDIASAYNNLGVVAKVYSNFTKSLEYHKKALEIRQKKYGNAHNHVALSYRNIGTVYYDIGEFNKALDYYLRALKIRKEIFGKDHPDVAGSYNDLGIFYMEQGNYNMAIEYFNDALKIVLKVYEADNPQAAILYNNIGSLTSYIGHYDKAIKHFKKALDIRIKVLGPNHDLLSGGYHNIGEIYLRKGDYNYAIEYYKKSMQIDITNFGIDNPHLASNYNSMGAVYEKIGEYDKAIAYYEKAIDLLEKQDTGQEVLITSILGNIAIAYDLKNDTVKAEKFYYKSLNKKLKIYDEMHEDVITQYSNLSKFYLSNNNIGKAYDLARKSLGLKLKLYKKHPIIASDYLVLASIYKEKADLRKSLSYINKAICQITNECDTTNNYWIPKSFLITDYTECIGILDTKAEILKALYRKENNIYHLIAAEKIYQRAFEIGMNLRSQYFAESSKYVLTNKITNLYENAANLEFQLYELTNDKQYLLKAFSASEYKKAGILKESINSLNARKFSGIPDSLISKEELIRSELLEHQATTIEWIPENKKDSIELAGINSRIIELRLEYENLIKQFETDYPNYTQLRKTTQFESFQRIQNALNKNDVLLEYMVTDSALHIFTISDQYVNISHVPIDSSFIINIIELNRSLKKNRLDKFRQTSQYLYEKLITPVRFDIEKKQKLIIIPDGIIGTIPFEALYPKYTKEALKSSFKDLNFLIKNYDIVYQYSADLWLNNSISQPKESKGSKSFVGFAPVFKKGNNQGLVLNNSKSLNDSLLYDLATRSGTCKGQSIQELKYSEEELRSIVDLFKKSGNEYKVFLNKEAHKANFMNNISNHDIIHIATHGFSDDKNPELSGLLFYDNGIPDGYGDSLHFTHKLKTKGFLYSSEMYSLKLNADLVVLSACETGTGKFINGEGMISLTRGLMYSGAQNLIVSLWKVGDKSTKELMLGFYKNLLNGDSKSRALRNAKVEMINNSETAFPKFWSGFVLIGSGQ